MMRLNRSHDAVAVFRQLVFGRGDLKNRSSAGLIHVVRYHVTRSWFEKRHVLSDPVQGSRRASST